ncbi:hypothetical protein SLEP1_g49748 [Rubroshorea leprosula]|uniref:Uncharacterized protein n=1 Tax=Rubroshorea leprosula TaxID=152421 RepID=A0AAV5M0V6_9ROSI|nr:hypothetical protein SLEP1_g49748 [Rubroshorea leprosula]
MTHLAFWVILMKLTPENGLDLSSRPGFLPHTPIPSPFSTQANLLVGRWYLLLAIL